jgi:hypothetical protein
MAEFTWATAQYDSGDWDSAPMVAPNLIDSIARYTTIDVAPTGVIVPLGSRDLFKYPLVFLTGHLPVRFSDAERSTMREYCRRGGLVFVDDHNHDIDGEFHRTAWEEIAATLEPLRDLRNNHEIYRSFFTFPDGPPTTSHELNGWGDNLVHKHLQAVERDGRIVCLYSSKDYASEWNYHPDNKRFLSVDNTRFGVNVVVYALTR